MVFIVMTLLAVSAISLCACNIIEVDAPENLTYNGSSISWNAVEGADYYLLQINNGEEKKVTTTVLPYAATGTEFNVKVTAVSELKKKIGKSGVTEKVFKVLPKIESINFYDNGTAYWGAVNGATGYAVTLNGAELDTPVTAAQFSDFIEGQNTIQVRPVVSGDDSWYSVWSDAKVVTKLGTPSNITYDGDYIRWTAPASGAYGYEVLVNGTKLENVSGTSAKYNSQNVNFDVTVKAIGNHVSTFDSNVSQVKKFVYLNTVSNITVTDGIVGWPEVSGADGYIVKVGNNERTVNTNQLSGLVAGETHSVSIKPISNDTTYFSNFCAPKNIYLLKTPVTEWISGHDSHNGGVVNSIQWEGITGASGYKVKIMFNGNEVNLGEGANLSENTFQYGYAFLETGEYKVYVKATSTGADTYDSAYGEPFTVTRLPSPTGTKADFIKSDPTELSEGFRVNFNAVSGASGYQLFKDSGELKDDYTTTNQFHVTDVLGGERITTEQKYVYTIRTKGSDNGRNIKLDSLPSADLTFHITVQAMPANPKMNGYTLSWGSVSGAQYNVKVGGSMHTAEQNSSDLSKTEVGTFPVSVNSRGNGSNVLPSLFTSEFTLTRLRAVEDLYVTTGENDGILNYTDRNPDVNVGRNFEVYIDSNMAGPATTNKYANINDYISTKVSNVFVRVNANAYDNEHPNGEAGATYYMSSPASETLTLARLETVTFAAPGSNRFTNSQFMWNAPGNCNANGNITPTYRVYKGAESNELYHNGELNGTSLDISGLAGRADKYDFVVKAIGDGRRYLNSKASAVVSILKVRTPVVKIENNAYTWNAVSDASKYAVYVNDKPVEDVVHQFGEKYTFTPNFTSVGSYSVSVYAIGDNGVESIDSDPCKFNQTTKKLSNPEFSFRYSHTAVNVQGTIDFTIDTPAAMENGSPSTKGYTYSIGGASNSAEDRFETAYSRVVSTPGEHRLSVRAVGGDFDGTVLGESAYYVASDTVGGGSGYALTILGKLNQDRISLTMDKLLRWEMVTGAVKFEYRYAFDGADFAEEWTPTANWENRSIDLSELYVGHSSIKVQIRAIGNGTNIISGDYAEKEFFFS